MNHKTDPPVNPKNKQQPSFSGNFVLQIVILTLLVLAAIVLIEHVRPGGSSVYRSRLQIDAPMVFPWLPATDLTYGLSRPAHVSPHVRLYMLAGVLVTFVICPTVFLFGWRRRRLERIAGSLPPARHAPTGASMAYMFCGSVTLLVGVTAAPYALLQELRNRSACDNNEALILRSHVLNEIHVAAADAFQYRLLPKDLGGGDGSYAGYVVPPNLARTDHAEYSVTVKPDTVEIRAESAFCATDHITVNLDKRGQTGAWHYQGNWGAG